MSWQCSQQLLLLSVKQVIVQMFDPLACWGKKPGIMKAGCVTQGAEEV